MTEERIQFGSETIRFRLVYADRKTLGITVTPEREVVVRAPAGSKREDVLKKVRKKAPWIIRQQRFFLSFHPRLTARRYVSGETHLYLGRQYRLLVEAQREESVKLAGRFLRVQTPDPSRAEKLVKSWYLDHARAQFAAIAEPLIGRFEKYGVRPSALVLRDMPLRWGSCTPKGKIILNPELIRAPRGCIEYVIIHELCHLVHHDHTRKFIALQTREMPDWEKWKWKLENLLA